MRFTYRIKKQQVPQWGDCYIGYKKLKILLKVFKQKVQERIEIQRKNQPRKSSQSTNNVENHQNYTSFGAQSSLKLSQIQIKTKCDKANNILIDTINKQVQLFGIFIRNKFAQAQLRYRKCLTYYSLQGNNEKQIKNTLVPYIECIYVQASNLANMYESNMQAQRRILDKHMLYAQNLYQTPSPKINSQISIHSISKLIREIQKLYIKVNTVDKQSSRFRLRKLAQMHQKTTSDSMVIGIMIGIFFGVCIFVGLILGYLKNQVQTDPIFNVDFGTWRGSALFILYIWSLGVNLRHFEKHNISHRTILQNYQTEYPTSTNYYKTAGFFSAVIVVLFTLYVLNISDVITLKISPQLLPIFIWVPLIIFLVNPISIFFFRNRDYALKSILNMIISFAIPITFPITFNTDQLLSILVPIRDSMYTICYYSHFNLPSSNAYVLQDKKCQFPSDLAIFIFGIVVFCYRIMQSIKCGIQNKIKTKNTETQQQKQKYNIIDFFNAGKYTVAMLSTILSYLMKTNRDSVLPAWIIFAIITSIYTYYWDLKYDWLLLDRNSERFLLRDHITYPKKFYYILIVVNFFLRCSWVLTISPQISSKFIGSSQIFLLLFAFLEIIRRGIWNMLAVQAVQHTNCKVLNSLPQFFFVKQQKINQTIQQNKPKQTIQTMQRIGQGEHGGALTQQQQIINKMVQIHVLVEADRLKTKETKKFLKQCNNNDEELIDYLDNGEENS